MSVAAIVEHRARPIHTRALRLAIGTEPLLGDPECPTGATVQRPSIDTNPPGSWPVIGHFAFERGVGIA